MTYEELKAAYEAAVQKCSELEKENDELKNRTRLRLFTSSIWKSRYSNGTRYSSDRKARNRNCAPRRRAGSQTGEKPVRKGLTNHR